MKPFLLLLLASCALGQKSPDLPENPMPRPVVRKAAPLHVGRVWLSKSNLAATSFELSGIGLDLGYTLSHLGDTRVVNGQRQVFRETNPLTGKTVPGIVAFNAGKIAAGELFRYFACRTWTCGKGSHVMQYIMGASGWEGFVVTRYNRNAIGQVQIHP